MTQSMVVLLTLLTAGYAAVVLRLMRVAARNRDAAEPVVDVAALPAEDQPPPTAVGWPPAAASAFTAYVQQGVAALDDWLARGATG